MAPLSLSPLLVLAAGALLLWALGGRIPTYYLGLTTAAGLLLLAFAGAALSYLEVPTRVALGWAVLNGQPLVLQLDTGGTGAVFGAILLLSGAFCAGSIATTLGRATHTLALVFSGLLVLLMGGLLTIYSGPSVGALAGLGLAWLGSTIMQQAASAHGSRATFAGLPALLLSFALLGYAVAPTLSGGALVPTLWLGGCGVLIVGAARWGTTPTAPALVRAPTMALGLPLLGGYLLVGYGTSAAAGWSAQLTAGVLLVGLATLLVAALNALVARRLTDALAWQLVAQLAFGAICFGTGNAAAGPVAAGFLTHTVVVGAALALAVGQLERATRTEQLDALPPLPTPLRRAGTAYALAALSAAGLPPLLGYTLRSVVLQLAPGQLWVTAVILGASTLLALSFVPTLLAFFRRPAFRSPLAAVEQRGGGWPLLLMLGLLAGGLVPNIVWQWLLGDPSAPPPATSSLTGVVPAALTALLALLVFAVANRALRHPRPQLQFGGGEPLDEEPGWALPFTALPATLAALVVPERLPGRAAWSWTERIRERLEEPLRALERRYYLALVVICLISVLLLAAQ